MAHVKKIAGQWCVFEGMKKPTPLPMNISTKLDAGEITVDGAFALVGKPFDLQPLSESSLMSADDEVFRPND